ncbi:hypothetical protein HZI73_14690 [Vallitalea pronyensis]|uniref:Uncharacterized protein n=1 Tax=Vallitalea pronyensis TaxID=1348613 RepID=A0A8J8SHC8_9FIRM|nr:hypothetical protein [Vallitalea pronyensis]QUI23456.1 hypothetical protein HZI73_14690 [Vallitalea pronyensis]
MAEIFDNEFFRTSGVEDFKLKNLGAPPKGFPTERVEDVYTDEVICETYEGRRKLFIEHVLNNPGADTIKGFFYELIRIQEGQTPIYEEALFKALDYVNGRWDCADFIISGMMRLYKQLGTSPLVSKKLLATIKTTILNFKYWPDEPGVDSMCYWTENHHIIFSSAEYLAGTWFPEDIFTNSGMTGMQKKEKAKKRIYKWLAFRFYTGFSEWLSNVYYDEDFVPLLNLYDFTDDIEMKRQVKQMIDLMLYDMAINSYKGMFTCTHGRTYTKEKLYPTKESTIDTAKLMFGLGCFANEDNMSAVIFTLSSYRMPEVIAKIAQNIDEPEWLSKQRVSIRLKDRKKWGLKKCTLENAMILLSFGGYSHPYSFNHLALMLDAYNWWDNKFFLELKSFKRLIQLGKHIGLTNLVAWVMRKDMSRNSFEESNVYTFRTPDYMMSTSQAYRPSYGGDQHHIWQATLDKSCVVFTTHPGGYGETAPDAYWHGNGFLPKSIQYKNVNITMYKTPSIPPIVMKKILDFTHAFFPKKRFDEVVEKNGWVFGRSNKGYVAIYSRNGYRWQTSGPYKDQELMADGKRNIWVTELGRQDTHGDFENFVKTIANAKLSFRGENVTYDSHDAGTISTGWYRGLSVNGQRISIKNYKRYDNKSCHTAFMQDVINIQFNDKQHVIRK